jgi:double-stranded uracil-DNA glycosylase
MPDISRINTFLQDQLSRKGMEEVSAVEAASWLHDASILRDSESRRGKPLRDLLRQQQILGQRQEANGRWFIERVSSTFDVPITRTRTGDDSYSGADVLPDILGENLRVVFVGTAVGDTSANRQHYYSHSRNCFYQLIYETKIVPILLMPEDDFRLLEFGIGLTDLVKTLHTSNDSNLTTETLCSGLDQFRDKILRYKPTILCFNSMNAYIAAYGTRANSFGLASNTIGNTRVFVVPSTSGRVSDSTVFDGKTRKQWFQTLSDMI